MPAALEVNWAEVQMLALTVGVREAARQLGISEDAVRMRSSREGWIADRPASVPLPPTMVKRVTSVTGMIQPSAVDAFKNALNERGNKSRMGVAIGLGAAADRIAEMDGDQVLANSSDVKNVVSSLSTVHAWDQNAGMAKINLQITSSRSDVESVDAEWTEAPVDKGFTE